MRCQGRAMTTESYDELPHYRVAVSQALPKIFFSQVWSANHRYGVSVSPGAGAARLHSQGRTCAHRSSGSEDMITRSMPYSKAKRTLLLEHSNLMQSRLSTSACNTLIGDGRVHDDTAV